MLQQSTLDFLKDLKANNNKEWFEKNRKAYDAARADQLAFVTDILAEAGKWEESLKNLDPKKCVMRINRDIRFSNDKSPYKSAMSFHFTPPGGKAGYYFHLEPGNSFVGGGVYGLEPPKIKAVRQEIDYNLSEFQKIMSAPGFKKYFDKMSGEALKTVPREYPKDHPAAEWLKHKDFHIGTAFTDKELLSKDMVQKANDAYKAMVPFMKFLDRALGDVH